MGEKLNLTWHNFSLHGHEIFKNLLETKEFSDVTLVSDDQHQYRAHKFILSASSSTFKTILTSNPLNSLIYLRGIHHEEIESILQYIYLGEAKFYHEKMNEFLNVAKDLNIKDIGMNVIDEEIEEVNDIQSFKQVEENDYQKQTKQNVSADSSNLLIHEETKPYKCQQCDYQAASKPALKYHMQSKM